MRFKFDYSSRKEGKGSELMGKELKPGYYCQWCYQQLVDSAINQGKGVRPGRSEESGNELCGCGKKAVIEAGEFYDIKQVEKKFCAFDKDRVCDETCVAYLKDYERLNHEVHFDPSNPTPQFEWKRTRVVKSDWCDRLNTNLGEITIVKRVVDGKVV